MSLDVPIPESPSLHGPQSRDEYEAIGNPVDAPGDDYRREELETILASGAWDDAFEEWAAQTVLTPEHFQIIVDYELIDKFDFYWDETTDEVGYQSPTLPDEARSEVDRTDVGDIDSELDTLGRVVSEMLENDYLLRDEDDYGFYPDEESDNSYESRQE